MMTLLLLYSNLSGIKVFSPLHANDFSLHFKERSQWQSLPEGNLLAFQAIDNII